MKPRLLISFSGGKTSGCMTKKLLDNFGTEYDMRVVFANTGEENEATLQFVHDCDTTFGFGTAWIEGVVHHGDRISTSHKIVTFENASRSGEPFEEMIRKYGIPNKKFPHCTRELKKNPIEDYAESIGWTVGTYLTAIGIRTDERRRVKKTQDGREVVYPMVDWFPMDKQDVNDWWEKQPFNLDLREHEGNCRACWKKSFGKLYRIAKETPAAFDFFERMEAQYGGTEPELRKDPDAPRRVFFRGATSTVQLRHQARVIPILLGKPEPDADSNDGCTESCELYATEQS